MRRLHMKPHHYKDTPRYLVGSKDKVETNKQTDGQTDGRTEGRTEAIPLPPCMVAQSVIRARTATNLFYIAVKNIYTILLLDVRRFLLLIQANVSLLLVKILHHCPVLQF